MRAEIVGAKKLLDEKLVKNILFNWELSDGKLLTGQGTRNALIDPSGFSRIDVKLRLEGAPPYMEREKTCELEIDPNCNAPSLFDEYGECGKFINAMLGSLPNDVWKTSKYGGSLMDNFNRILNGGGFWSGDTMSKNALALTDPNTMTTTFDSQRSTPLITGQSWQQLGATVLLAHELTHVFTNAPNYGAYGHLQMAQAAQSASAAVGIDLQKTLLMGFPDKSKLTDHDYDVALSGYFNAAVAYHCRKVKL